MPLPGQHLFHPEAEPDSSAGPGFYVIDTVACWGLECIHS